MSKTNALRNRITEIQQLPGETIPEVWEGLQEYIQACPHHGIEEWLIIHNFFHGLNQQAQDHVDAAAGGSFLSLDVVGAKALIDKIASKQSWKGEMQPAHPRGVHQIDTVDMLVLSVETHRRAATGNTKSREVTVALAGTAPLSTARISVTRPEIP